MSDITPRLGLTIPAEFEEPWADSAKGFELGVDVGIFANAENSQLQFLSNGLVGWNATGGSSPGAGVLFWSDTIYSTAFSTTFRATIAGPASIELQDSEVLFFIMPRLMASDTPIQLFRSNRIFLLNTKIHDLRLFCARFGSTLYFYNGKSLKDGDNGSIFGGGLNNISIFPAHDHLDPLVIQPPAPGIATLDAQITTPALLRLYVYRNGQLLAEGIDYTLNPGTGIITLTTPTVSSTERFIILRERRDTAHPTSTHTHLSALKYTPLPGQTVLDALVTAPTLDGLDLYRNGFLQAEPDDYSLDPTTGFVTLVTATLANEVFQLLRRINV